MTELDGISMENYSLSKVYGKPSEDYKIPLKTHRVWVTSPDFPQEAFKVIADPKYKERIMKANEVFES